MSTTTTLELRGRGRSRSAHPRADERHLKVVPPLEEEAVAPAPRGPALLRPSLSRPSLPRPALLLPGRVRPGQVRPGAEERPGAGPAVLPRRAPRAGMSPGRGGRTLAARLGLEGLRLTARGRVAVTLVALVLAAPLVWGATAVATSPADPVEVRPHAVEPGDTLWGVAASVAEPGQDVRDVVRELRDLNRLPSGGLMVGQTLYVPVG
ncbi:LysM peptidoglycan-binding domain-containing protein [Myceligenerans indicum]|uniref:LysM peptidoglycan-binding domain-containing protein n=1 Tax=Myceligenerans indicum TaxID=2593663 RepID=A0ABS1LQF4_9MICO|nr:LysM peptidoglycan-binding domain-containing protein [Myceligenerans indicum]MBL0888521.1 LysM peptidoglycan-binding domain-containing protein [Myceligenerans indicum]